MMKALWMATQLCAAPLTCMSEVGHRFGAPRTKHRPAGDPLITRWDYDEFSVYFEYDKVLTAALKHKQHSASQQLHV